MDIILAYNKHGNGFNRSLVNIGQAILNTPSFSLLAKTLLGALLLVCIISITSDSSSRYNNLSIINKAQSFFFFEKLILTFTCPRTVVHTCPRLRCNCFRTTQYYLYSLGQHYAVDSCGAIFNCGTPHPVAEYAPQLGHHALTLVTAGHIYVIRNTL